MAERIAVVEDAGLIAPERGSQICPMEIVVTWAGKQRLGMKRRLSPLKRILAAQVDPMPMADTKRGDTILEARGITKRYPGVTANDHIDFEIRAGEVHAILGRERRRQDHIDEDPFRAHATR